MFNITWASRDLSPNHPVDEQRPYLMRVIIPDGEKQEKYIFEFRLMRQMIDMSLDYMYAWERDKKSIMDFHKKTIEEFEAQPDLFFARRKNPKAEPYKPEDVPF